MLEKSPLPSRVATANGIVSIACGSRHTVILYGAVRRLPLCYNTCLPADGSLKSCGNNSCMQLGLGDHSRGCDTTFPRRVLSHVPFSAIACGIDFSAALASAFALSRPVSHANIGKGTVWTWGAAFYPTLGYRSTAYQSVPRAIDGLSGGYRIGCGHNHTIVATSTSVRPSDQTLTDVCWQLTDESFIGGSRVLATIY
jgi:hypothetical protein